MKSFLKIKQKLRNTNRLLTTIYVSFAEHYKKFNSREMTEKTNKEWDWNYANLIEFLVWDGWEGGEDGGFIMLDSIAR